MQLGRIIAESAKKLADSTHGARALEVLLAIQTPVPECAHALCCHSATPP